MAPTLNGPLSYAGNQGFPMTKPQDPIEPVSTRYPPHHSASGSACQNCDTMLQGGYCHVCGQHAHNPLRSFRHAVEDVFESFWHVDGRIFRTLRDLLVPGKITTEYLAGHRVRYIPPLRLYVILSLITFFVAHFVTAGLKGGMDIVTENNNAFAAQTQVEEVIRARDEKLAALDKSLADTRGAGQGIAAAAIGTARESLEKQAQARIDEINGKALADDAATASAGGGILQIKTDSASTPSTASTSSEKSSKPADKPETTEDKLERTVAENARLFSKDKRALAERILTHTPGILLALLPIFALVLRLVYPLRPMGYLEQLVVALYSHAFLLLVALTWMLMLLLDRTMSSSLLGAVAVTVLPILVPIYLLLSQKRIYGDGWPMTLLRFAIIAMLYFALAVLAVAAAFAMALLLKG